MEAAGPQLHLVEAGVPTEEELAPCPSCGRTFVQSSLERHVGVCTKNTRRSKFDSSKQRIHGTGLEQFLPPVKSRPRSRSVPGGPRRGSIPLTPVLEKCEHCGRGFGDKAIERHREFCKNQKSLRRPTTPTSPAFERMQARTKYKAPMAKTLRARTREKYSPGASSKEPAKTSAPTSKRSSVSHTPTKTSTNAAYDVFQSAERQMQELLGSPLPSRKAQPYIIKQKEDIELNLEENFIRGEEDHESLSNGNSDIEDEEDSSIEEALNEIQHQDSFSSVELFKDEEHNDTIKEVHEEEQIWEKKSIFENGEQEIKMLKSIKEEAYQEAKLKEEDVFNQLKATLEDSLDGCPLTDSLSYLDAALSLFQLEDIPIRPRDAPRTKASNKRRQYSAVSAMSLLTPDPGETRQMCSECGSAFPMPSANFCCLCGAKRCV